MKHIAILGLGPSVTEYLEITKRLGGRSAFCDEVWTINALGDVFACDLVWHMDDIRIQQIRAAAKPESNIARMVDWLKTHKGRVMTSRAHPDFPALEEFPLADVVTCFPKAYFNSTAAYAVAYAVFLGVTRQEVAKITIFGNDFTYPNAHHAEKGRACVEFWLGIAAAHGIELSIPRVSSLMDALSPQAERFYGYDTLSMKMSRCDERVAIAFQPIPEDEWPTAEAVEKSYDHTVHPNRMVASAA